MTPTIVHNGAIQPRRPANRITATKAIETVKPAIPNMTMARLPCLSERPAQKGAEKTQSSAETENTVAITLSGTPIERPIDGSTDCSAVLPAPVISITRNRIEKSRSKRN